MRSASPERLTLMVIDNDPQFRRGLVSRLAQDPAISVALEADSETSALRVLQHWLSPASSDRPEPIQLDVILLSLDLPFGEDRAIALARQLQQHYPDLPILLTGHTPTPATLAAAFQAGLQGFCRKDSAASEWTTTIRQVAAGYSVWGPAMGAIAAVLADPTLIAASSPPPSRAHRAIAHVRQTLHDSGLAQIDAAIADLNAQLASPTLTSLDYWFLTGRRRELRASRWLIQRFLATAGRSTPPVLTPPPSPPAPPPPITTPEPPPAPIATVPSVAIRSLQTSLFDTTFAKLQLGLRNLTVTPLEIDILRDDRKRELLAIVLRQVENQLVELRETPLDVMQLVAQQTAILTDIWQAATIDFFGRYTTISLGESATDPLNQQPVVLVDVLLQDRAIVQTEILSKIPMVADFFAHLLLQTPLMVDELSYAVGTVEATSRIEALLQNLVIQVGNAVMQPLLNRFGNVVAVKQNFYDRRLLSTREIERFRNDLSWQYRMQRYFKEPTAIFESRYHLFVFNELGILSASIYAPRNDELDALSGLGLAVTLSLEARDAIAPRLRTAISFIGSGVVYVLTEVIGRGIGLIGRGIIKGVGNVIQDTKFSRDSQR